MSSPTVVTDLTTEVPIPEEGTLSRVLYKDDRIRVVAFAFDEGQELTEHTAGVPAVIQVVSGRMLIDVGDGAAEHGRASWIHLPAGTPHSVEALEPSVLLLTLLKDPAGM